ncbi:MAG: cobalamin biosynthesis protein CbiD [Clostridiales bacterium]|nr:cobalamin biosynthesis protein CbiD [Clostridiales bacterium]
MAFEYYHRSGTKMLRYGYTTGTCAALAAAAATRALLSRDEPGTETLMTSKGIPVSVSIEVWGRDETGAWASVCKDAGDDSDVTDGMEIRAHVSEQGEGITIDGGAGVGRVTKPGLDQPVGNAAINSGPRAMIRAAVEAVCKELDYTGGIDVIISVPEGEAAAAKTFNPKLGIEGGISILGTTGIVEPMSEQALIDTIEIELKQTSLESDRLILTPGNYGEDFIEDKGLDQLGVPVQKFSNFLGETLDIMANLGFREVLLVAHVGKLSKVAAGIMNTHSKYADGRNEIFCAHGAVNGADTETCRKLMDAATTDACIEILDEAGIREEVIKSIMNAVQQKLEHRVKENYRIGAVMFSNVYGQLGITEEGKDILRKWEDRK